MIKLLVYIKHHISFVWRFVELINSRFIALRYADKIKCIESTLNSHGAVYQYSVLSTKAIDDLFIFFKEQPDEYFDFFRPHKFDQKTLASITKENNYIAFCIYDQGKVVGYCFLRLFFTGKAFTGLITHKDYQGKGLGKLMIKLLFDAADILDVQVYSTISKDNVGSLKSHAAVRSYTIKKELANNYLILKFDKA